jgi:transposase
MYSYDDRLRAVQLYIKQGKRAGLTIRPLGRTESADSPAHGPRTCGKRDDPTRHRFRLHPGGAAAQDPSRSLGMYTRRNEVERLFRRLKGYRRIFSRFEKLDLMFLGFISFVLVADGLRTC